MRQVKRLRQMKCRSNAFAEEVGNGHAARSEICHRQSSGTQQRCAISSAIALAGCTWLLDIGDRRMRIGDVRKPASDFLCKARIARLGGWAAGRLGVDNGHSFKSGVPWLGKHLKQN